MDTQMFVAVWVERFQQAVTPIMVRDGNVMRLCDRSAVICASTVSRELTMELTSNALSFKALEKLERLQRHGFTVIQVPDCWAHEGNRPSGWRDQLANMAMDRAMELPDSPDVEQLAPYDEVLAHEVLTIIERDYPHWVSIIDVKQAMTVEPSDNALITALEALSHEKKIEGGEHSGPTRRLPINVELRPTPQGRDEVRGTNQKPTYTAVIHGDQYNAHGPVGAIGRGAVGTINYQPQWVAIQDQVNLPALAIELEELKSQLLQTASSSADFAQVALVAQAKEQAEAKDGSKMLETLSKAGSALLGVAKEVGTDIAAKVITTALGIES
ncbi:MAG TPA: hypothetical protein VGB94_10575 [Acidobacteriaceae bacterium]